MSEERSSAAAAVLDEVFETIRERQRLLPEGSYVTHLLQGGVDRTARKVGEEAIEVVLAAKNEAANELTAEVADLWFHCLVLLAQSGCTLDDIYRELAQRHGKRPSFQAKAEAHAQLPSIEDV
ncbi:MAG: phosphoribosyl-ATP diphosphatase, partial [Chloroflexota bacterium]|nr:phosphoribosyl-ATP diphosphatase [Chloroflexota bacterium]MDE2930352.1 phosphoribosyl-ATP diphosphatase [Chloroflexota bacterium]